MLGDVSFDFDWWAWTVGGGVWLWLSWYVQTKPKELLKSWWALHGQPWAGCWRDACCYQTCRLSSAAMAAGWSDSQYPKGKLPYPSSPAEGCISNAHYFLSNHSKETFHVSCPCSTGHRLWVLNAFWRGLKWLFMCSGVTGPWGRLQFILHQLHTQQRLDDLAFHLTMSSLAPLNFWEIICWKSLSVSLWVWLLLIHFNGCIF